MRATRKSTKTRTLLALLFISYGESARNALNAAICVNPDAPDYMKQLPKTPRGNKAAQESLSYAAPEELALARYMARAFLRLVYLLSAEYGGKRARNKARNRISDLQYKQRNADKINASNTARHRRDRFLKNRLKMRPCMRCGVSIMSSTPGFCRDCRSYAARVLEG